MRTSRGGGAPHHGKVEIFCVATRHRPKLYCLECAPCLGYLAQVQHRYWPLAQTVDYAELFVHDEAQQETALARDRRKQCRLRRLCQKKNVTETFCHKKTPWYGMNHPVSNACSTFRLSFSLMTECRL